MNAEMSRYKDFTAEDFALDEHFQQWVLRPDRNKEHFWNSLIADFPDKKKDIEEAIELVRLSGLATDPEANAAYLEVWHQVGQHTKTNQAEKRSRQAKVSTYVYWAAAALAGIMLVSYFLLPTGVGNALEYRTAYGEIKDVVLPDGSNVTLNANSTLTVSGETDENREVSLQGEAFFKVVKTSDQQTFTVKTPAGVTVRVLGTEFNVNTRREQLAVYLQSGKVQLKNGEEEVMLNPGERADFENASNKIVVSKELPDVAFNNLAWKDGNYIMNDHDLLSITRYIEDNFGVRVQLNDSSLKTRRVTARVPAGDLKLLLNVIAETLELDIEEKENTIIIRPLK